MQNVLNLNEYGITQLQYAEMEQTEGGTDGGIDGYDSWYGVTDQSAGPSAWDLFWKSELGQVPQEINPLRVEHRKGTR